MPYCTALDVRKRAVGMTEAVIPDSSEDGLNLATCIAEADAAIEEAASAGGQTVPFDPVPAWIAHLSAVGALAQARRGLQAGNQQATADDPYAQEFEAGLARLREGEMPISDVVTRTDQQE